MNKQDLRESLAERGVIDAEEFELVLNSLLDYLLARTDPPIEDFFDEELAFLKGFMLGTSAMHILMTEIGKRNIQ